MKIQTTANLLLITLTLLFTHATRAADCDHHLPYGIPTGGTGDKIICYSGFVLSYDYEMKVSSWVSYTITKNSVHGANVKRASSFKIDKNIPRQYSSSGSDYSRSGYDRGHLAPSAQIDYSRQANNETFLYSNMTPQLPGFNRDMMGHSGAWGNVEGLVRKWIYKHEELNIIAGTYFNSEAEFIGNGVGIPAAFYKIILNTVTGDSISFWFPHVENTASQLASYVVPIDEIELRTGIDFFSKIPDSAEDYIERKSSEVTRF